jgi:membrane protease YdiL (CAAX protease family)
MQEGIGSMFFQQAYNGKNRWWRWLLTISAMVLVLFLAQIPVVAYIGIEAERFGVSQEAFYNRLPDGANRNLFLALFLMPFVAAFLALWFCISRLHKKSLLSVMTGRAVFDTKRALSGFIVWFALLSVATFAVLPAEAYTFQFNPKTFAPLLVIALLLFPIQTTLEEVFFRGYLMQGFFLLVGNKLVPLVLVTMIFMLAHYWNPEFSSESGLGIIEYLLMSLFLGLMTVLDDGLEVPCGIHAANNIFLSVIMSATDGSLQTDALFETNLQAYGDNFFFVSVIPYALGFMILFVMFRWRFSTLIEPVRPAHSDNSKCIPS